MTIRPEPSRGEMFIEIFGFMILTAPAGAESVSPHGEYLLTDLHSGRFCGKWSPMFSTRRVQGGALQVHYWDCTKQWTKTNRHQRHAGPCTCTNWFEASD